MRVVLVCSDPSDCLRSPLAARPASLGDGLLRLLRDGGHEAELVTLPSWGDGAPGSAVDDGRLADAAASADVLHVLDVAASPAALRVRRRTGTPTVVRAQVSGSEHIAERDRAAWLACLRAADTVMVPTRHDERAARALGVPAERIATVLVAAAGEVGGVGGFAARSPERVVSVLSGPHAWGGTVDVVAAVSRVPDVELVVAGRSAAPEAAERLATVADACGAADRVTITGWLDEQQTVELVDRSAVVVAPRRGPTTGAVSLRAMGRARPVVAYESPVQAEIVVDGETGVLVPMGSRSRLTEVLAGLLADPFRAEALGQAGQDRVVARFGTERTLAGVLSAYENAVERRPRTAFIPSARTRAATASSRCGPEPDAHASKSSTSVGVVGTDWHASTKPASSSPGSSA
ncbi:MAG TPA: glycosyltransferase family 4 protein [Actinomycetales bacterium]|nr:glycosyltransferase family 4 protein [Actinomycetales bacterium]